MSAGYGRRLILKMRFERPSPRPSFASLPYPPIHLNPQPRTVNPDAVAGM
jgi:hypothetical protein